MYLYRVVPEVKVPSTWLTYSSQRPLVIGQLVYIPLRTKTVLGLVIDTVQGEYQDAKSVGELFPLVLASNYLRFLYLFSYNTLNDYNNIIAIVTGWMSKLNQKQLKILTAEYQLQTQTTNSPEIALTQSKNTNTKSIDYSIVKEQWFRIRVIIRSLIEDQRSDAKSSYKTILVLLPEKSQLATTKDQLKTEFGSTTTISTFAGDQTAESRSTLMDIIVSKQVKTPTHIVISTRSGVFLPFDSLHAIVVLDEGNHLYIQEQNGVYYDARDASYIMAEVYKSQLFFVSNLPSIRLHNFDPERSKASLSNNYSGIESKLPRIKIYKRERKDSFNNIFSQEILHDIGVERLED